ncbi:unnamed protein product [Cuscuta epithymum]|uniref:RNA uridylyltransferase n=1 Tax=Cuscuta epithymum TaxID=186058 RepID=A0AAV0DEK9_9ASTE|nr:unnamed protein product [Cuscuta epithymum]
MSNTLATGGGDAPPPQPATSAAPNCGEFLLQLLQKPPSRPSGAPPSAHAPTLHSLTHDPAVARVGPSVPLPPSYQNPSNGLDLPFSSSWQHSSPPSGTPFFAPHDFFARGFPQNPNPNFSTSPGGFNLAPQHSPQLGYRSAVEDAHKVHFSGSSSRPRSSSVMDQNLVFGSLRMGMLDNEGPNLKETVTRDSEIRSFIHNGRETTSRHAGRSTGLETQFNKYALPGYQQESSGGYAREGDWRENNRVQVPPMGNPNIFRNGGKAGHGNEMRYFEHGMDKGKGQRNVMNQRLISHLDQAGPSPGIKMPSVSSSGFERLHSGDGPSRGESRNRVKGEIRTVQDESQSLADLQEQLISSLGIEDGSDERADKNKRYGSREKENNRSDNRGKWLLGHQKRIMKSLIECRSDICSYDAPFLDIYQSLIPSEEEKAKQEQLMTLLKKIVAKEWPDARLHPYGSCSNSFGFSKSDIDICLAIGDNGINKSDIILRLAELLEDEKLQNVQALVHARVPIVKLMDPETGISCDICVNNLLAVENTKLLRDYAQIDARLRQIAFIVKHWAKTRGVNETYRGTLSSYAYVLMCIHLLQQRRPAILPCLQGMKVTYYNNVDDVECAYFDKVDDLLNFGSRNRESLAHLVWAFFTYWAYCHDYANDVISIRTGSILSKRAKDWTRRIGNDRHLICIEDPFEVSHDLGRVVDKFSIRVLREEFERAAEIMQHDPNPCAALFEPYVPS